MNKQVIIFIAPPGAGKGTQAEELAKRSGLIHLETSKIIEEKIQNADPNDIEMQVEKQKWTSGQLITPAKVAQWFIEKLKELAAMGKGLIFSGSPRTLYEAKNEIPELESLYGEENIKIFNINLSEEESIKRNSARRICQANRHPVPRGDYDPKFKEITVCPWDGSPIITRALDKPEIIRERYRVYKTETEPVLDYLRRRGYKIIEINGEQPIEKVTEDIIKNLEIRI